MYFNKPEINFDAIDFDEIVTTTSGGGEVDYCTGSAGTVQSHGDSEPCGNSQVL